MTKSLYNVYWLPTGTRLLIVCLVTALGTSASGDETAGSLTVRKLGDGGSLEIVDGGRPVLCYNDAIIHEPPEAKDRIRPAARKYAVPRCNYIHPLYGLGGEILTEDWASDHPHHRGIYWAWPEVDWQGKRGDLHALQKVFNHPTGKTRVESGHDFVQIVAEHEWQWEDGTAIVREQAVIRAYRRTGIGRPIDLEFRFVALGDDVHVARRGQSHYGGLNVRLGPSQDQEIVTFTDPADVPLRRAWAHRSGTPQGGGAVTALTILQNASNPAYPGDWVQFPNLSWVQPTFPAAGTRHTITKDRPLELRFRLWIHEGKQGPQVLSALWSDYHAGLDKPADTSSLDRTFQATRGYQFGQSRESMLGVEALVWGVLPETRKRSEERLIGILRDSAATVEAKEFACRQLALIGSEACVPAVAPYLIDPALAHAARYALRPIRSRQADQALLTALDKASGGAKAGLILLLGQRRDRQAVGPLIPLLQDNDPAIVRAAVSALGKIGGKEAARALADARPPVSLRDALLDARLACAEQLVSEGKAGEALSLYRRDYSDKTNPTQVRIPALRGIVTIEKDKALKDLRACLAGDDTRLRLAAVSCMSLIPNEHAVAVLAEVLPQASPDTQVVILAQLAGRGDPSVAVDVARLTRCADPAVGIAAIAALGDLGQATHVGLLVESAGQDTPLAAKAFQSLVRLRAEGTDAEILRQFDSADDAARLILVRALRERGVASAVPRLLKLAGDAEPVLREEAIKSLGVLVDEASLGSLVRLLAASDKASQKVLAEATVTACKRLRKKGDILVDAMQNADTSGRAALLAAIGPLGGEQALPAVAATAADPDATVQDAAILALSRWPDASAVPELMRLLANLASGPRQAAAVRGCASLLDRVDLPPEEKTRRFAALFLSAVRPEEKRLILASLSRVKCLEALELAGSLLVDEQVRSEAGAAMAAIALPDKKGQGGLSGPRVAEWLAKARAVVPHAASAPIDLYLAGTAPPDSANLALGRPVKTSVKHQGTYRPELAVDGKMTLPSFWSGEDTPAWLSVDLGRTVKIDRVLTVLYWGKDRYYQYTLDVSQDGQEWKTVADQSKNTTPSMPNGLLHTFDAVEAKYVRVNILKNSANPGAHIVEVKVYAAP